MKKAFVHLLCFMLCLSLMATYVPKAEAMQEGTGEIVEVSEVIYIDQVESSESVYSLDADGNVALKPGDYERWIDRLDLTDAPFALDFYAWLEANIDDALVDPSGCATYNSNYVYTAKVNTGTIPFTYDGDPGTAASEALTNGLPETLSDVKPYLVAVYSAFDRDHPEVFWLTGGSVSGSSVSYSYSYGGGSGTVSYTQKFYFYLTNSGRNFDVRQEAYRTSSSINTAAAQRDTAIEQILSQITATNTYDQVRQLNRILTTTNCYNSSVSTAPDSAYECTSALLGSTGSAGPVCEGYSRAFKVLCDELEIPCVLVDGMSYNSSGSGAHMWNNVQMPDGNWYAMDVTWNDPVVSGKTTATSGYESENYLLVGGSTVVGDRTFSASHVVENSVVSGSTCFTNGPVLASAKYTYVPVTSLTLSQTALELEEGDAIRLSAAVAPTNASEKTVVWSSDNPSVATVSDGTVTAVSKGKAVITAKIDGVSAQCAVTVFHTHIHAGAVTTQPTCTKEGVTTYTCACGDSYTESIPVTDHNYVDGVCTVCGDIEIIASGTCGENLTWVLDAKGTLTISGTGAMENYDYNTTPPWDDYDPNIICVVVEDGVTTVGDKAFVHCYNMTAVKIPDSIISIGEAAFAWCQNLSSVTIPDSVTSIGDAAFQNCESLPSVTIPESLTYISNDAFLNCQNLSNVVIPDSITSIGYYAFAHCEGLTSMTIPGSVKTIGENCFESCKNLTSVTVLDGVQAIGDFAFYECENLIGIQFCGDAPKFSIDAFDHVTTTVHYPYDNETWTSDVLQNYGGNITWVAYGAPEIEKFDVAFSQVDMGNALGMNFAFPAVEDIDFTGAYAEATMAGSTQTIPADKWTTASIGGTDHYVFGFSNIAAKQMADEITIVIYNADGEAISNEYVDSIQAYVMRNVDKKDAESKALMVDMLNYGAAAQTYYGYNAEDLANAQLTDAQKAYGTATMTEITDGRVKGDNYLGTRLELGSRIGMQMNFAGTTADMYAVIEFTNHGGTEISERVAPTEIDGAYLIVIDQIVVADGRMPITVTVYNADGTVYGSATDSMASYIARMSNADALYENIMKFSDSAFAYLH